MIEEFCVTGGGDPVTGDSLMGKHCGDVEYLM